MTALGATTLALTLTRPAAGYEASVDASTRVQHYQIGSPYGPSPLVRRTTQTLGLALSSRDDGDRGASATRDAGHLELQARLRLDTDFGIQAAEVDPTQPHWYQPGLDASRLDVLYAYVQGRGYLGGSLDFSVGRQYVVDPLGWWAFDGGRVTVHTPLRLSLEALTGYEQRGGSPLPGSTRFGSDGVRRGDRSQLASDQWTDVLAEDRLAPAWGVAIQTRGLAWLSSRLAYRRVTERDAVAQSALEPATEPSQRVTRTRLSSEKLGHSLWVGRDELASLETRVVYDALVRRVSDALAVARWWASPALTLQADAEHTYATFDGDSIFNWLPHGATSTASARALWQPPRRLALEGRLGTRFFDPGQRSAASAPAATALGSPSAPAPLTRARSFFGETLWRLPWPTGTATLRAVLERGDLGRRAGGDLGATQALGGGAYEVRATTSLYDWRDAERPERAATTAAYVLGASFLPFATTRVGLEWEHAMNHLVGQRFRVLALLDLAVLQ